MRPSSRLLAASSLLYPVLLVIGFAAFPKPPGGDVSPAHDPAWLGAHTGAVIAQSYVRSAAALGLLLLAVALATWAKPTVARLIVAGGAGSSMLLLIGQGAVLGAALGVRSGASSGVTRSADNLSAALLDLSSLPAVLLFAAAATTLFATPDAPRWLVWLTALGAPLALVDAVSYDSGPLEFFGIVGLAYFLIWSLLTAVTLIYTATRDSKTLDSTSDDAGERVTVGRR
jgi:hypothetical protein